jgi:hypothetical protein
LICVWSKPKSELPTAMQKVADAQDTPVIAAFGGPLGPGTACGVHVAPEALEAAHSATAQPLRAARRTHVPIPFPIRMSCRPTSGGGSVRETAPAPWAGPEVNGPPTVRLTRTPTKETEGS